MPGKKNGKTHAGEGNKPPPRIPHPLTPHLCLLRTPLKPCQGRPMGRRIKAATYNVHRWTGFNGQGKPDSEQAGFVISEMKADVIALQEVLRPFEGNDPLIEIADRLGFHVAFASTRIHRLGELGNAILSRWPIAGIWMLDLTSSKLEKRLAVAAQLKYGKRVLEVVATHLSLADRSRHLQVRSILDHPRIQEGPALLLGDMNAWRKCRATRALNDELKSHNNRAWPPSFPSISPMLALDRVYGRGLKFRGLTAHDTPAARRASDHLPVIAKIELPG